jgi:hypothetical protein
VTGVAWKASLGEERGGTVIVSFPLPYVPLIVEPPNRSTDGHGHRVDSS